jgi:hypothetical protein
VDKQSAGDYADHCKKSNPKADDETLLEQGAVKKEQLKVKHRAEDHESHSCIEGEADEGGCDKSVLSAAKRQDHRHRHHSDRG